MFSFKITGLSAFIIVLFPLYENKAAALKISTEKAHQNLSASIADLQRVRRGISAETFNSAVYDKLCPYLEEIGKMEKAGIRFSSLHRRRFLREVVRIYDRVMDFSYEHHTVYCVYHYYGSSRPTELFDIAKNILSRKKQKKLQYLLDVCKSEETYGNGDRDISTLNNRKDKRIRLISDEEYRRFSLKTRRKYIQQVKKTYLQFEERNRKSLSSRRELKGDFLSELFFPRAAAATRRTTCLIGGRVRETMTAASGGVFCPSAGNPCGNSACGGNSNTFKCGGIYHERCVCRKPVGNLSRRCSSASLKGPLRPYSDYSSAVDRIEDYCRNSAHAKDTGNCNRFKDELNHINTSTLAECRKNGNCPPENLIISEGPITGANAITPEEGQTEAGGVCLDCALSSLQFSSLRKTAEELQEVSQSLNDPVERFVNLTYENSSCYCGTNDGCSRGCNNFTSHPPSNKCTQELPRNLRNRGLPGKKNSRYKSTGLCMKHITGSLMNTLHSSLREHCQEVTANDSESASPYSDPYKKGKCYKNFSKESEPDICRYGFKFPSALCALAFGGEEATVYNKAVKDERVRNKCKRWHYHNQALSSIVVRGEDGKTKKISIFKTVPREKYAAYQTKPETIPSGALIVSKTAGRHGHIEIKTDKKCGPGKAQSCFCSDFCAGRKSGYHGKEIEAVFEWNPEFIKYVREKNGESKAKVFSSSGSLSFTARLLPQVGRDEP